MSLAKFQPARDFLASGAYRPLQPRVRRGYIGAVMPAAPYISYFDETGHSAEGEFVGIAGFVGLRENWQAFRSLWANTLGQAEATHFHAREFSHSVGSFKTWKGDEPRRRRLLAGLIEAIRTAKPTPVGAIVDARAVRALPELIRSRVKDPYCHCFQTVARGAAIVAMFDPPETKVDVVVADVPGRRGDVTEIWKLLPSAIDHCHRLGDLTLASPRDHPELQAADFLAYEMNLEFERVSGRKTRKQRWPFKQFLEMAAPAPMLRFFDGPLLTSLYGFRA
jgi:hypothetical protein